VWKNQQYISHINFLFCVFLSIINHRQIKITVIYHKLERQLIQGSFLNSEKFDFIKKQLLSFTLKSLIFIKFNSIKQHSWSSSCQFNHNKSMDWSLNNVVKLCLFHSFMLKCLTFNFECWNVKSDHKTLCQSLSSTLTGPKVGSSNVPVKGMNYIVFDRKINTIDGCCCSWDPFKNLFENSLNWKMSILNIGSCQNWKLPELKLPKLKVAKIARIVKIENC